MENSALKKPVGSVPSSGRPTCEATSADLRILPDDLPRSPRLVGHFFQRGVDRKSAADIQVAFLQLRHELAAQEGQNADVTAVRPCRRHAASAAVIEAAFQLPQVTALQVADQPVVRRGFRFLKKSRHSTGARVKASSKPPPRANA